MLKTFRFILTLALLAATGCAPRGGLPAGDLKRIVISPRTILEEINLSDFANHTALIQLETSEECLLGSVDRIEFWQDTLVILDKRGKQAVLFDSNGRYISKIHQVGQGPGEYQALHDLFVDDHGRIHLLTWGALLRYQTDGTFLEKIDLPLAGTHIAYLSDSLIVIKMTWSNYIEGVTGEIQDRLASTTIRFDRFVKGLPFDLRNHDTGPVTLSTVLTKGEGAVYHFELFNDTIYEVTGDQMRPYLFVDFGPKRIPANYYQLKRTELMTRMQSETDLATTPHNYLETRSFMIFSYITAGSLVQVLIDKSDGSVTQARRIINDLDGLPYVAPVTIHKGQPVYVLPALDALEYRKSLESQAGVKPLAINANDNPILVLVGLRR